MACKAFFNGMILLVAVALMIAVPLSSARALSDDVLRQRIEEQTRNDKRLERTRVVVAVQDGGGSSSMAASGSTVRRCCTGELRGTPMASWRSIMKYTSSRVCRCPTRRSKARSSALF